jgi:hypothetical protein
MSLNNGARKTRKGKPSSPPRPINLHKPDNSEFSIEFTFKDETHYIAKVTSPELAKYKGGYQILNPWESVQLNKSHGLCQMFSFFLLYDQKRMNKSPFIFKQREHLTKTFINSPKNKSEIQSIFSDLVKNTLICMTRSLELVSTEIKKKQNPLFKRSFKNIYEDVRDSMSGEKYIHGFVPRNANYETFLEHFRTIVTEQNIMKYMLDQFIAGTALPSYNRKGNIDKIIGHYFKDHRNKPEPICYDDDKDKVQHFEWNEDNNLVVRSSDDGECVYDAFQSVFMAIMGTEDTPKRRSPFALLCEKEGITMVEKK